MHKENGRYKHHLLKWQKGKREPEEEHYKMKVENRYNKGLTHWRKINLNKRERHEKIYQERGRTRWELQKKGGKFPNSLSERRSHERMKGRAIVLGEDVY